MTCDLALTYDASDKTTVPADYSKVITDDQIGCNLYIDMIRNQLKASSVLHVGVGNSSVYWMLQENSCQVDGITIVQEEATQAEELAMIAGKPYCVFMFNKYDVKNMKNWPTKYSCIVDNNLKQHACCEDHWRDYWFSLLELLDEGGTIVTHEQGFGSHKNMTTPLSIEELKRLSPGYSVSVIETIGTTWHPVVIRRKHEKING